MLPNSREYSRSDDAVKTEDKVNHSQPIKRFGLRDDGKVAAELSYAVSRLLAYDWDHLDLLFPLAAEIRDQDSKQFVVRHFDAPLRTQEGLREATRVI